MVLGIITYLYQKERLKFIHLKTNLSSSEIIERMNLLCEELKWNKVFQKKNIFVLTTNQSYFPGSLGEQITVLINGSDILINSINNPSKKGSLTFLGVNQENVKVVIDEIQNSAN
jgi:hypothetical protein